MNVPAADRPDDHEVTLLHRWDDLQGLAGALRAAEPVSDFYSTWPWFENLSAHGIEPAFERLFVVVRHRRRGSVFCLPLLVRPRAAAAVFGPVTGSLSNYYSSLFGPIGDPAAMTVPALRAAFAFLRRHRPAGVVDLQPLDPEAPLFERLAAALRAEAYVVDDYFCFGNWHLEVGGRSFAAYEPTIPSRLRNTIKRGRKKLESAGAWTIRIQREPGAELESAIADIGAIYAKSWKVPEPFPQFVPGLCRAAAANGWLRLGVLRFEGQPIAAQLWVVKHGRALIYKLAYDEEFKRFSAGSVLSAEMMRSAIDEDHVDDVDYLTGDDAYKVDWMSHRRERRGLVAFHGRSLQGIVSLAKHRAGRWARKPPAAAPAPAADAVVDEGA